MKIPFTLIVLPILSVLVIWVAPSLAGTKKKSGASERTSAQAQAKAKSKAKGKVLTEDEALAAAAAATRKTAGPVKCVEHSLTIARERAKQLLDQGEPRRAVGELERALKGSCNQLPSKYVASQLNKSYFLVAVDLADAYLKAGEPRKCLEFLGPHLLPDSPKSYAPLGFEDSEGFVAAMEKGEQDCTAAIEKKLGQFDTIPCKIAGNSSGVLIGLPPQAKTKSCLVIAPAQNGECPKVALLLDGKSASVARIAVKITGDGPLNEPSRCCSLAEARATVQLHNGDARIRFQGPFRGCAGSEEKGVIDAIYVLDGSNLSLQTDMTVSDN